MNVILLEKVDNLGEIGQVVKVASGYGRNFLIPQGKAKVANEENLKEYEAKRAEFEAKALDDLNQAKERALALEGKSISVTSAAGPEGKLFGSIGPIDISDACTASGVDVNRSEVRLPDGPFKEVGEYDVKIHLHAEVDVTIKLSIIAEEVSE